MSHQLPIKCSPMRFLARLRTLSLVGAAGALLCSYTLAQCPNGTSIINMYEPSWGGSCPGGSQNTNGNCSYYSAQVSAGCTNGTVVSTMTLLTEMGLVGPTSPGSFELPKAIQLPSSSNSPLPFTLHEVHGNIAFTVWPPATCGSGYVIAQVRDQNGNTIADAYLVGLPSVSSYNIPIKANLATPLPITSLQLLTNATKCNAVTISWSLVMD
jgi:hypothetical protein